MTGACRTGPACYTCLERRGEDRAHLGPWRMARFRGKSRLELIGRRVLIQAMEDGEKRFREKIRKSRLIVSVLGCVLIGAMSRENLDGTVNKNKLEFGI